MAPPVLHPSAAGLSQEELAHAAGVSVRAPSDLERGRSRGPQRRTVQALSAALGLDTAGAQELERVASLGRPRARPRTRPATGPGQEPAPHARTRPVGGRAAGPAAEPTPLHTLALPRDLHDFTARGPALSRLAALRTGTTCGTPPVPAPRRAAIRVAVPFVFSRGSAAWKIRTCGQNL
ncbi:helix-turn-helix transcriptional regulator [Streptomyces sp. NPDC097981]|uniref:helix-turn-helix domain-containing protein n=1 Tax=Streptomyces sp. NPDC097981 TaxID=3155428 RepID=UPI00331D2B82